ncbi:uncharacterized protein F5147DRAFT_816933 [Suillus discolor]|uniref:Uncharacterized protein n=1 Tax=Suillus discolor TaxID=1912936 RepID=A0A9P7EXU4_9AGAM|nr:uncharacterized protein F5147DRAFT_816933 [Suillus discolor]KAG2097015.1 hypothetical protein F5147DRAFT_816933 [Suillus discolor]
MSSDDVPMPPANQKAIAPENMAPTHHMNTDSCVNKRTRPTSPTPNPSSRTETPNTQNQLSVANAQNTNATPNKRPNIERPNQPQATTNQWHFLQTSEAPSTQEVSINGVRTLDSGFKITATPAGGFPVPQLGQSTWHNVSQILKEKWPQKEGAKAWVRTYRAKHESNAQSTVAKLKDAITKIIGESDAEDLVVSTPTAAVELIERLPPPWHFLISGIPPEAIERLLRLQVCSSPEVSCFFVPFEQPLPTYAFTLENFSFPDSESTNKVIAEIVKDTIRSNPDVLHFIHKNIPSPDAEAALHTIESVRVTSLTLAHFKSVKETVWNIYFDSPPALTLK